MKRRGIATLVTLAVASGVGHLALGRYRRAAFFLLLDAFAWSAVVFEALRAHPHGMFAAVGAVLALRVVAIADLLRDLPGDTTPPRWRTGLLWLGVVVVGSIQGSYLREHVIEAFSIPSGSMVPALEIGDHIMVDKRPSAPARGDVIVFQSPRNPGQDFVKRVAAVAGDRVELVEGVLRVNDQPVRLSPVGDCSYDERDETTGAWEKRPCQAWDETLDGRTYRVIHNVGERALPGRTTAALTVPAEHVYVLGDNRDNSYDSRFLGPVPSALVRGKVLFVYWSRGEHGARWDRVGQPVR